MIPLCVPEICGNELKYIKDCMDTNWVSYLGAYVDRFEKDFADYLGVKYAVAVVNGTAAIHTALCVLDIKAGDEVIVPVLTFIASVNPVIYCGATPVFVDVEPDTGNIDSAKIEDKISEKTKAILPVHLYGHPAQMQPVLDLADKYNLLVIEDACESLGSKYKGK